MPAFPNQIIRNEFPSLALSHQGQPRIYLDNPGGTQVPKQVIEAVSRGMIEASSNYGGFFPNSDAAVATWDSAHQAMADMLGAASMKEIIIGQSMTSLTFHMSRNLAHKFKAGDEIIVTKMDHEGDVSPWLRMAEDVGMVVKWVTFNKESWRIENEDLEAQLSDKTKLVALNYASNLTGSINDIKALSAVAKKVGALVFVDAVQFAPHGIVDVQDLGCDFLACSSYKFFGPHLGIIWGRQALLETIPSYKCRCSSNELPERFELGTPQTELLSGLAATVDYLEWIAELTGGSGTRRERLAHSFNQFIAYENTLSLSLIEGLQSIKGVTIHGITNSNRISERVPTISFTHQTIKPGTIARGLAEQGVFAWSGHNYAIGVVEHLGLNEKEGVTRLGLAHYNSADEVATTLDVLDKILG